MNLKNYQNKFFSPAINPQTREALRTLLSPYLGEDHAFWHGKYSRGEDLLTLYNLLVEGLLDDAPIRTEEVLKEILDIADKN